MKKLIKYKYHFLLILIILFAFAVRIVRYSLDFRIEKDAVVYINMAKDWNDKGKKYAFDRNPRIPPLYISLMMLGEKVGIGAENTGVFISILAGSLTVLSVYFLSIVFLEKELAFIAAFLAAIHPVFIRLSPEVLRDSLFIFCYISSLAFFVNGIEKNKIYLWMLAGSFASLATMTRSEGAELIMVPFLWLAFEILLKIYKNIKEKTEKTMLANIASSFKIILKKYLPGMVSAFAIFAMIAFPVQIAFKNTSSTWTVFDSRMMGYLEFITK